jgi:uncharacterized protein (DUF608 family)
MQRRIFLQNAGVFAAGFYASKFKAIAGPFLPEDWGHNIPIDKKLDPAWIKSLFKRGEPTRYCKTRNELQFIGMPVGGINTGTVYLGGDGRLWLWDIFNANQNGIDPKDVIWGNDVKEGRKVRAQDGSAYIAPPKADSKRLLEQGFAFQIEWADKSLIKKMEPADWEDIIFEASYPMAKIRYIDTQLPVEISAEVYSPFIPLDDQNSGLPATIYSFHIKNKSNHPVRISITGWLENKVSPGSALDTNKRINKKLKADGIQAVECSLVNPTSEQMNQADFGTLGIAVLQANGYVQTNFQLPVNRASFAEASPSNPEQPIDELLLAAVGNNALIRPRESSQAHFVISWHFCNQQLNPAIDGRGRYYSNWFGSAGDVLKYVHQHFDSLSTNSRLWMDTWYQSSLPYWFLERTFLNISTLATSTAQRFKSGRFYGWEGVGCCAGTCTHVWQYAQAVGRIFPGIERDTRQRVDLGLSLHEDGHIWFRGEMNKRPAIDGQAGTVLRIYREHQMSANDSFLRNNWDKIKRATEFIIRQDRNKDGMEDTPLENTLDAVWDGEIAWIVGLCIAAVKAGELMAIEMNDQTFAAQCADYVMKGRRNMETQLFNGEYFIHRPDPEKGRKALGSYNTCHIDQLYGQSWAHQVGMGRIVDREKTISALKALWKYNFTPDVGPYIKTHKGGRPYAMEGEGGMIMNTNPANEARPYGDNVSWQLGYFHECMSGFEHQVASHMMAEGMIEESLVLTRMIHDRYHAARRNPFNEIECSDHYARAMASYGTFITACGFGYHGPKAYMRFAPKLTAGHFQAAFVAAEGWGSYRQEAKEDQLELEIKVHYGRLALKTFSTECDRKVTTAKLTLNGKNIPAKFSQKGRDCLVEMQDGITINSGQSLQIKIS